MVIKGFLVAVSIVLIQGLALAKTTVKKENGGWKLYVNDKPFEVKGVTFGGDVTKENVGKYMKDFKFLGVNTIRTWGTNDNTQILLDSAEAYGVKVMVGIWMRHGRPGMEGDDSFDYLKDAKGMDAMYEGAIATVNKYKNHPAVLYFGVGNEVYLNIATNEEKLAYSLFLEKVCSNIKQIDADHPIVSVDAWNFGFKWWKEYVPSVDIYGVNSYGPGVKQIPGELTKAGVDKPYVITEFGVSGEWDSKLDRNGYKIEPDDKAKYKAIAPGVKEWITPNPSCLGSYVFHYGNDDTFGSVWLLFRYADYTRPQYWATREAYTGEKPINNVPDISAFSIPDTNAVQTGSWVKVKLDASDIENDQLDISFHYNQRSGSRARKDQINPLVFKGNLKEGYQIKVPEENGAIKIYAFVKDTYKNIGIAQTSIMIKNKGFHSDFLPGARTALPFYVYNDSYKMPYSPTAYMGNFAEMKVDAANKEQVHGGKESLKITYEGSDNWFGLGLVDPPNDWGTRPGGYSVKGAKTFTFWAKASLDNVDATFGFGMIGDDKTYYDTDKQSIKISLTSTWTKYEIELEDADLRCIRSGFTIYSGGIGQPFSIWVDDVQFK